MQPTLLSPTLSTYPLCPHRSAIASDDPKMRVVRRDDPSSGVYELTVGSSVKSLAWDPRGRYLAAFTVDGTVHLWDLEDPDRALVRSIEGLRVKEGEDPSNSSVEYPLAWHPTGEVLAAGSDAGAQVLARDSWRSVYTLRSPAALAPKAVDKYSGSTGLAWSPNGRFLAAIDSRRILTAWDVSVPAVDPVTFAPVVTSVKDSAGEPAVALHGYARRPSEEGGGSGGAPEPSGGATADIPTREMTLAQPRPTGLAWTADGLSLPMIDSDGDLRVIRIAKALAAATVTLVGGEAAKAGSPSAPLSEPIAWPLKVTIPPPAARPAAAAGAASKVLAAAAAPAQRAAAIAEGTAGRAGRGSERYGEDEAMEGGDDDEEDDDGGDDGTGEAAEAKALAARIAAGQRRPHALFPPGDDEEVNLSAADIKRKYGMVDDDGEGEDGIAGGVRAIDAYEAGDAYAAGGGRGGSGGAYSSLIATGKLVSHDELDRRLQRQRDFYGWAPQQQPFQPGATQYRARAGAAASSSGGTRGLRRFLAWNHVGAVVSRSEGEAGAEVDVLFVDKSRNRDAHISDSVGFSMAALSEAAVVFASRYRPPRSNGEGIDTAVGDGQPAVLLFRQLSGWGGANSREWKVEFPVSDPRKPWHRFPSRAAGDPALGRGGKKASAAGGSEDDYDGGDGGSVIGGGGATASGAAGVDDEENVDLLNTSSAAESPVAVAIGEGWVAAVTDRDRLRFIRTGGNQDAVVALGGPPITMAACGSLCAVAYHRGLPAGDRQLITVELWAYKGAADMCAALPSGTPRLVVSKELNLGPGATLQWMGFSSPGAQLMVHSSQGALLCLQPGLGWSWLEVCNTQAAAAGVTGKRATRDSFWPVAVVTAPASTITAGATPAAPAGASSSSAPASNRIVPVLRAVFLKAGSAQPVASTSQLPLQTSVGMQVPLLEASTGAFDDDFIRTDLAASARGWLSSLGISHVTGASLALTAAMSAAAASARGDSEDPFETLMGALDAARVEDARDTAELDKAAVRMIHAALDNERDVRAVQLASRLHMPKSYEVAARIASEGFRRGAVAERVGNLRQLLGMFNPPDGPALQNVPATGAWMQPAAAPMLQGRTREPAGASPEGSDPRAAPAAPAGSRPPTFGLAGAAAGSSSSSSTAAPPVAASARARPAAPAPAPPRREAPAPADDAPVQLPFNPFARRGAAAAAPAPAPVAASPTKRKRDAFEGLNNMSPQPVGRAGSALNRNSSVAVTARNNSSSAGGSNQRK